MAPLQDDATSLSEVMIRPTWELQMIFIVHKTKRIIGAEKQLIISLRPVCR